MSKRKEREKKREREREEERCITSVKRMDDGLDVNGHSSCLDSTLRLAQLVSSFPH